MIRDALPDYDALDRFVFYKLGLRLADAASNRETLPVACFHLIQYATNKGIREQLEAAVLRETGLALPGREVERYLDRLIAEAAIEAAPWTPLRGEAEQLEAVSAVKKHRQTRSSLGPLKHYGGEPERRTHRESYGDILDAYPKVHSAAVLGDPGAGKSTTLWRLCLKLAEAARDNDKAPVPVIARLGRWTTDETLRDFLAREAAPEIAGSIETLGKAGRLVLLLDGLNEVPTGKRVDKAKDVASLLVELNGCAGFLVSCRKEDYTGPLDLGLDTLTIEPLTPMQIRAAVRKWVEDDGKAAEVGERFFWQLAGDERLAGVLSKWQSAGVSEEAFWSAKSVEEHDAAYKLTSGEEDRIWRDWVHNETTLLRLASNPFMLTMLYEVWERKQALPRNRGELFGKFVNCLLSRERLLEPDSETPTPDGELMLRGLATLAWNMQHERGRDKEDSGVLTAVPRADAVEALGDEWLKKALDGTLLEGGSDIRFRHQLLQEYFTARALDKERPAAADLWPPERWWERSGWEEAAVLLAGFHGDDCGEIIRWLAEAQPEVTAQCMLESGAKIVGEEKLRGELQAAWLRRLTSDPQPEGRAAVGRALERLKLDNRKGVGVVNGVQEIDWVEIPGGEFIYQAEKRKRKTGRFFMARYPVTNAQFQAFVEAEDGYRDDQWWEELTNPVRQTEPPRWSEVNHPRETVSWYEAMAFCAWMRHKTGRDVRLPTEWEWERAARGTDGRMYPWGQEYMAGCANIDETEGKAGPHYLARTSAVGIYAAGASLEGVLDLSGNLWEWCLNEYEKPDRVQAGGEKPRVLRGGSWFGDQDGARADDRFRYRPGSRYYFVGFRVVCSSPSTNSGR